MNLDFLNEAIAALAEAVARFVEKCFSVGSLSDFEAFVMAQEKQTDTDEPVTRIPYKMPRYTNPCIPRYKQYYRQYR